MARFGGADEVVIGDIHLPPQVSKPIHDFGGIFQRSDTQTFGGTTIIGFRHEKAGHHTQVVPSAVASEGKWAIRVWPELGKKRLIRAWAGLRVMPDDSMAIYSRLPGHPNVTLVNTHSAVTMAAAHTRLLPDFILGGELPETAQGMTLKRFGYSC